MIQGMKVTRLVLICFSVCLVLLNLVGNAIKFSVSGGTVAVSAAPDRAAPQTAGKKEKARSRTASFENTAMIRFSVSDSGPGVPDDVRERMFHRFVNEGEETLLKGSIGLGLSVAFVALLPALHGRLGLHHQRQEQQSSREGVQIQMRAYP